MEKNDNNAAIIQLKNALQAAPDSAEARFLLAKSLFENGEPGAAETEIRKAIDLKYSADETYPLLARALLQQGQYEKVITALADRKFTTPLAQADALTSLGLARLALGQNQEARAAIDAALMPNRATSRPPSRRRESQRWRRIFPALSSWSTRCSRPHPTTSRRCS